MPLLLTHVICLRCLLPARQPALLHACLAPQGYSGTAVFLRGPAPPMLPKKGSIASFLKPTAGKINTSDVPAAADSAGVPVLGVTFGIGESIRM